MKEEAAVPKSRLRKMLCSLDAPYIARFMRLIETQSKATIGGWGLSYADIILPIYEKSFADARPRAALAAARDWFAGRIKLPESKKRSSECQAAVKEAAGSPAAQAAANACANAALLAHTPLHSLGVIFYGTAAIVYDRVGINETAEVYKRLAEDECAKMEAALRSIAVVDEPNPIRIDWSAFTGDRSLFRRC
jgi:hypothetical protein